MSAEVLQYAHALVMNSPIGHAFSVSLDVGGKSGQQRY